MIHQSINNSYEGFYSQTNLHPPSAIVQLVPSQSSNSAKTHFCCKKAVPHYIYIPLSFLDSKWGQHFLPLCQHPTQALPGLTSRHPSEVQQRQVEEVLRRGASPATKQHHVEGGQEEGERWIVPWSGWTCSLVAPTVSHLQ